MNHDIDVAGAGVDIIISNNNGVDVVTVIPDGINLRDLTLSHILLPQFYPPKFHKSVITSGY